MSVSVEDVIARFESEVIGNFQVRGRDGIERGYAEYMALPPDRRSGDEANVVDRVFTAAVLSWLDYAPEHVTYNETAEACRANKPDYVAHAGIGTAFIWEDKSTAEELDLRQHLPQLRRYCAGTAGYAVWCNARRIVVLRFDPNGTHTTLADVHIEGLFGLQRLLAVEESRQRAALELIHLLLNRARFSQFRGLLDAVCVNEADFWASAIPLQDERAQRTFISGASQVLGHLRTAALSRIDAAQRALLNAESRATLLHAEWEQARDRLVEGLPQLYQEAATEAIDSLRIRLGQLAGEQFQSLEEGLARIHPLSRSDGAAVAAWIQTSARVNAGLALLSLESGEDRKVVTAFHIWCERQPEDDLATSEVFAEQAAYVFFVRLLLARTLEDKRVLPNRIASDGGLVAWRNLVTHYFGGETASLYGRPFIDLLSERVSAFYRHFFQQPVFDWFVPDDFLLVQALEFLARYSFENVESDILGFTYEEYIERVARNKKGHFLTRPNVVDFMLDATNYNSGVIIGRSLLDPACGSGSFLVRAAHRYRIELVQSLAREEGVNPEAIEAPNHPRRAELARLYVDALQNLFYGMDIDPFSCYLAELNLLIASLRDLHHLWQSGRGIAIDRFSIFNTDSLDLPLNVLRSSLRGGQNGLDARTADEIVDEAAPLKSRLGEFSPGFFYVVSNPPYVTPKQHKLDRDYRSEPFFAEVLSGDLNTYILFLRLGIHYIAEGGCLCFIVPLTVLGDSSSAAIRQMLSERDMSISTLVRFYTGNVLFPGVDQATAIIVAQKGIPSDEVAVSGGTTVDESRTSTMKIAASRVLTSIPGTDSKPWLVSPDSRVYEVWEECRARANTQLRELWRDLDVRQGDVNATYVRRYLTGRGTQVSLYKGEDFTRFSGLDPSKSATAFAPASPADATGRALARLADITVSEIGVAMREIARLNTRDRLQVTLFRRGPRQKMGFTHTVWRFVAEASREDDVLLLLAILCSRTIAYLLNLFSTHNHVLLSELGNLPVPDTAGLPKPELIRSVTEALSVREALEHRFVRDLGATLPDRGGTGNPAPAAALLQSALPTVLLRDAELRGDISILHGRGSIINRLAFQGPPAFEEAVRLLASYLGSARQEDLRNLRIPEPDAAASYLQLYRDLSIQAHSNWLRFEELQSEIDEMIFDWYELSPSSREAVREGVPWARRR